MLSRECSQFLLKEISVMITASLTVLLLEWALYGIYDEIGRFDRTLRAELDEFEMYFNLTSKFFNHELARSQMSRWPRASVNYGSIASDSGYGASGYAMTQSGDLPVLPECPEGRTGYRGYDGVPGMNGLPGVDGVPGRDGTSLRQESNSRGYDEEPGGYGVPPGTVVFRGHYMSCKVCPQGVPGVPGIPGAEGPRGPPGAYGAPGSISYASYPAPGSPGQAGDKGRSGLAGESGRPGKPGSPGLKCTPGSPGRAGSPGPRGPQGRAGETKPRAERGPPGPQGIPGMVGRRGKDGTNGMNGRPGGRGPTGQDGLYCICMKCPPRNHLSTTITPSLPLYVPPSYLSARTTFAPWEDPANSFVDVRNLRRSARDLFPLPPPLPTFSERGVSLPPPNDWVEDISFEARLPSSSWEGIKWNDVVEKRKLQWKRRWETRANEAEQLPSKEKVLTDSVDTSISRHSSTTPSYSRTTIAEIGDYEESGELNVLQEQNLVDHPRRLARLMIGSVRGAVIATQTDPEPSPTMTSKL